MTVEAKTASKNTIELAVAPVAARLIPDGAFPTKHADQRMCPALKKPCLGDACAQWSPTPGLADLGIRFGACGITKRSKELSPSELESVVQRTSRHVLQQLMSRVADYDPESSSDYFDGRDLPALRTLEVARAIDASPTATSIALGVMGLEAEKAGWLIPDALEYALLSPLLDVIDALACASRNEISAEDLVTTLARAAKHLRTFEVAPDAFIRFIKQKVPIEAFENEDIDSAMRRECEVAADA